MTNNDWRILKRLTDDRTNGKTSYCLEDMLQVARRRIENCDREFDEGMADYITDFYKHFLHPLEGGV